MLYCIVVAVGLVLSMLTLCAVSERERGSDSTCDSNSSAVTSVSPDQDLPPANSISVEAADQEPHCDVSVTIKSTFMVQSSVQVEYFSEVYTPPPLNNLEWTGFCEVYFQSIISDGDKQNWEIVDIKVEM